MVEIVSRAVPRAVDFRQFDGFSIASGVGQRGGTLRRSNRLGHSRFLFVQEKFSVIKAVANPYIPDLREIILRLLGSGARRRGNFFAEQKACGFRRISGAGSHTQRGNTYPVPEFPRIS